MPTMVTMPQLGESVVEGTVGKWLVKVGDRIQKDQAVVEILTDKADSEVPAPTHGVVSRIVVEEGATVAVGDALCEIDPNAAAATSPAPATAEAPPAAAAEQPAAPAAGPATPTSPASSGNGVSPSRGTRDLATSSGGARDVPAPSGGAQDMAASPAVRKMAREHGVDLQAVRITRDEVLRAAQGQARLTSSGTAAPAGTRPASGAFKPEPYIEKPGDEIVPFSRRRRIIADHMVYSKLTAPHVMTVAECDLQRTARLRAKNKGPFKNEGLSLTYLSFVSAATVRALRDFRVMNARVLEDATALLKAINLGIAVETEQGLVVPVIRNADDLTVRGLVRAIDEVAIKAREGRLSPDDLSGKSFTISNPGRLGNLYGAAIISQPNVGILRIGEIKKRPVVVEIDREDVITIHPVMHMALSYDHRVVDGVTANGFLHRITEILEAGDFQL